LNSLTPRPKLLSRSGTINYARYPLAPRIQTLRPLIDLYERAIQARVIPSTGAQSQLCFMCDLQRSTVETLVTLGWLQASEQDELTSIPIMATPTSCRGYR
jgi:hypothetical protein